MTKQLCFLSGFFWGPGGGVRGKPEGRVRIEKWGPFSFVDWKLYRVVLIVLA